jgi:hypothetical protein
MGIEIFVTVRDERNPKLVAIFGTNRLPVTQPAPELRNLNGVDGQVWCFFIDLDRLTLEQRQRLVNQTAKDFHSTPDAVEAALQEYGMPLIVGDCEVHIHETNERPVWLLN